MSKDYESKNAEEMMDNVLKSKVDSYIYLIFNTEPVDVIRDKHKILKENSNELIPDTLRAYIPVALKEYKQILEEYGRWKKYLDKDRSAPVVYPVLSLPRLREPG